MQAQEADSELRFVRNYLLRGDTPSEEALALASPEAKYYWINKELFQLKQGLLCRMKLEDMDVELVIPRGWYEEVIRAHHDIPAAAHQGVARTKARVKEKFFWFRLAVEVTKYVLSCEVCNRNKISQRYGRAPLSEYHAGSPMERVHLDFLGALPKTAAGNE